MAKHPPPLPDFESALNELDQIASSMESGQLPLEKALDAYQRGITLLRHCQNTLSAAELKIESLDREIKTDTAGPEQEEP